MKKKNINRHWTINGVINEAWEKVSGMKGIFFIAFFISTAIEIGLSFVIHQLQLIGAMPVSEEAARQLSQNHVLETVSGQWLQLSMSMVILAGLLSFLVGIFVDLPMRAGLVLMGLRRAGGKSLQVTFIFKFFKPRYLWRFAGLTILLMIIFFVLFIIGFLLYQAALIHIGQTAGVVFAIIAAAVIFYFLIGIYFALPVLVDQDAGPWFSIVHSFRVVTQHWLSVFILCLFSILFLFLGLITLGIGLIWTLPLIVNINGILYRELFGLQGRDPVTRTEKEEA